MPREESFHYLALEREALHRLMKAGPALAIDVGNRLDLEGKLIRMNQRVTRFVVQQTMGYLT